VTYFLQTLDSEIEARRRADHLVAGLMKRVLELAATVEDAPVSERQTRIASERAEVFWTPSGGS
jgi:hypothetical protein